MMEEPFIHKVFIEKEKKTGNSDRLDSPSSKSRNKNPIQEKLWLSERGFMTDALTEENQNKQVEQAVLAYPIKHYYRWQEELQLENIEVGSMGEDFSVLEMDEYSVFIGDIYRIGDAVIQVAQPRLPTWHIAERLQVEDLAVRMQRTGRTGWYFRVLKEGFIQAGTDIDLMERPNPRWSIAACNEIMHLFKEDLRLAEELMHCPALAKTWKQALKKRLLGLPSNEKKRLYGI
ncbi:6-N-hydroxylaminopurine resistance protein [Virgibacillus salexigens]|uniref:6-N-hydroxylaminopurine resistance protein n=1 Tax=Virgibacillus massiliensis TaxID=1462526 RepID=A0A024QHL0_9BACI|nr:6-N-hydroxylaminopurine resistance protein [Virgibacillus massiliensis]